MIAVYTGCPKYQYLKVSTQTQFPVSSAIDLFLHPLYSPPIPMTRTTPGHPCHHINRHVSNIFNFQIFHSSHNLSRLQLSFLSKSMSYYHLSGKRLGEYSCSTGSMPRVLLEKMIQPGRLELPSVTGPQGQLGFQCYQITLFFRSQRRIQGCLHSSWDHLLKVRSIQSLSRSDFATLA